MNLVLSDAKYLYDLGFAIHWLLPKEKRPVESGWTTGPRKSWEELKKTYRDGYNVGVRLGEPSKVNGKYLAVLDVDIKSPLPSHKAAALKQAAEILKGKVCPVVHSGRGNGSRHYYFLTDRPFKTFDPATCEEKVEVFMPSKKASHQETLELGEAKIAKGLRLSSAWGLSMYSDGRQVVLPSSIHPDSGKPYVWGALPATVKAFPYLQVKLEPLAPVKGKLQPGKVKEVLQDFRVSQVDLEWLPLKDSVKAAIVKGEGVTDRSTYLMTAVNALKSSGLGVNEILSVLTHPKYFLAACAYDHAQTKSRKRAAEWLYRYTVAKVFEERSAKRLLEAADFGDKELTDAEMRTQEAELGEDTSTTGYYSVGKNGGLKPDYEALFKRFKCERPYRTIADMKAVYAFNGTHYVDVTPIELRAFTEKVMDPKPEEKVRKEFFHKIMANFVVRRNFFTDTVEGKINFKNGVLDLNEAGGALLPHGPAYGFRGVLPYDYTPGAKCPVFREWIEGVMLGDKELVSILQEYMGYVVRGGEYKYHKALWLGGVGRNGKSTFVDLLKALIGIGNFSVISIRSLMNDKFAGAELDGKIANFSEETSPEELRDSGPFKNLTGDGEILAQKKFGDLYTFRNRAKLIMTYNKIPDLKDLSRGMLSRPLIVPFEKEIKEHEQDKDIKKKLFKELPGIFNFALGGWERLEAQSGFTHSTKSELALRRVEEESCNVFQWVKNNVTEVELDFGEEDKGETYTPGELYDRYKKSERYPYGSSEFFRRLANHPIMKKCRHKMSRERTWIYRGINVRMDR